MIGFKLFYKWLGAGTKTWAGIWVLVTYYTTRLTSECFIGVCFIWAAKSSIYVGVFEIGIWSVIEIDLSFELVMFTFYVKILFI